MVLFSCFKDEAYKWAEKTKLAGWFIAGDERELFPTNRVLP
jgi:hypothetical protein